MKEEELTGDRDAWEWRFKTCGALSLVERKIGSDVSGECVINFRVLQS